MAESISIVMKMTDDISGTMRSIASSSVSVSKQFEEMQRKAQQLGSRYDTLNKKAASTSAEALKVKKAMDEAAKTFKKSGEEADKVKFENLKQEYAELTDASKGYSTAAKETIRDINDVHSAMKKLQSGAGGSGSGCGSGGGADLTLGGALAQAGLTREFMMSAAGLAGALGTSLVGQPIATVLSSTLSGVGSGVAAGALLGSIIPGFGTAVGALVGGAAGLIKGGTQIFEAKDDAFKSYYQSLYETAAEATTEGISSGMIAAASRETTKLSFDTLLGSKEASAAFLEDIQSTAASTPFGYDDLTSLSKTLLTFGYAVEDIIPTLTKVGDAGAALGLSTADINTVATYIGRMQSSDKATLEYLNPLNERGFSVFQWIADDLGITIADVYDKISKSELSGGYVSDLILARFADENGPYAGMMDAMSKTTEGLDSTLEDLLGNIDIAGGDAYNALRNEEKERSIASYEGPLGDALTELSRVSGENRAQMENLADQYTREALSAVLLGEETSLYGLADSAKLDAMREEYALAAQQYADGSFEAGLKMEQLKEDAEALATAVYESSDLYQEYMDVELSQIDAIRENTIGLEAATNAYRTSNAFTKGAGFTIAPAISAEEAAANAEHIQTLRDLGLYAYGLSYVPYDNYPAMLHEGERVLTAEEARRKGSDGIVVLVTDNNFNVRDDSDVHRIAREIANELKMALVSYGG